MKFKNFRIVILMLVLAYVVADRMVSDDLVSDWSIPLKIVVYPVNGDGSAASTAHIKQLQKSSFNGIAEIMQREGERYDIDLEDSIFFELSDEVSSVPPQPPKGNNIPRVIWWSLKLRFWIWRNDNYAGLRPDIKVFVLFFDPNTTPSLEHSTGLEQGHVALVNAFAHTGANHENNFVILHEVLHRLGATDKYNLANNQPFYPDGYAEPNLNPLYPQRYAEVMGGRIPESKYTAIMPDHIKYAFIGPVTAAEIGWIK